MRIFQAIRRYLTMLNIEPGQSSRPFKFNGRLSLGFLLNFLGILLSAMFIKYSAEILMEFMQCFCIISALISLCLTFAAIVLQEHRLFNYIDSVEELINRRKCIFFVSNRNRIRIEFAEEIKCRHGFRIEKSHIESNS